jgi:hypothetical protein
VQPAIQPARFLTDAGRILPGVRRLVNVPSPASGADFTQVVPGGVMWRVSSAQAFYLASATVASRNIGVSLSVNGSTVWLSRNTSALTASQQATMNFASGLPLFLGGGNGSDILIPLPQAVIPPGGVIASSTNQLQAGDQWSGIAMWIEEYYFTDQLLSELEREREHDAAELLQWEEQQARTGGGN